MLAAKTALTIRYDALGEDTSAEMGAENRLKVETRLRHLEERGVSTVEDCIKLTFLKNLSPIPLKFLSYFLINCFQGLC